jgi:hypothetical protein
LNHQPYTAQEALIIQGLPAPGLDTPNKSDPVYRIVDLKMILLSAFPTMQVLAIPVMQRGQ